MFVERKDKDTDADVDKDQMSKGRPANGQSIDLFTQRVEIDIDFSMSGLPHAVVKQAENFRVHEFVKKIESHLHQETFSNDLQQKKQNIVNNPFNHAKAMIREMGILSSNCAKQLQKYNVLNAFLESRSDLLHFVDIAWLKSESNQQFFNQWRLDAFSIPHCVMKKERHHGARHGKTEAQKEHFVVHNAAEEMYENKL